MSKYYKTEDVERIVKLVYAELEGKCLSLVSFILGEILSLPTIEVSEDCISRAEGEWLQGNPLVRPICSVCGEPCIGLHGFDYKASDFCPNCGAKMRGADDD